MCFQPKKLGIIEVLTDATTCVFCEFDLIYWWHDNLDSVVLWQGAWCGIRYLVSKYLTYLTNLVSMYPVEWFLGLIISPDQRCSTAHTAPWSSLTNPVPPMNPKLPSTMPSTMPPTTQYYACLRWPLLVVHQCPLLHRWSGAHGVL